jgi:hypothetical protein
MRDLCEATPGVSCVGYRVEELAWLTGDESDRVHGQAVSAHYFTALGIDGGQGGVFTAGCVREASDTAVVTHAFWERRLGLTATARNWNTVEKLLAMASE